MHKNLKIKSLISLVQKSQFGNKKYFGYNKYKYIGIIKITTNKKIIGFGETLVGVYSPKLFKINLSYIAKFIENKSIDEAMNSLNNLKRNKFFFDNGILKSIISGIFIALIDILAQKKNKHHGQIISNLLFNKKSNIDCKNIYASAGSIISSNKDFLEDLKLAKKLDIDCFKGRLSIKKDFKEKIFILRNEIKNYSIDLISNTFNSNNDFKRINNFFRYLNQGKIPLWVEEVLRSDLLQNIHIIKNKKIKLSYGENFNSIFDFINLINHYKFDYINPDLSHFDLFDFAKLSDYLTKKRRSKKIIMHCWGGSINFIVSMLYAYADTNQVKMVEFPITKSKFMNKAMNLIQIKNSRCYIDEIKSFSEVIDFNALEKIKTSKLTFNF